MDQQDELYSISKVQVNVMPNLKYFSRFIQGVFVFKMNDFRLDDQNGNFYVSNLLDREEYHSVTLYASKSYRENNFRSDHALIQIQIVDTNDNLPLFTRPFYEYSIYANYKIGSFLFRKIEVFDRRPKLMLEMPRPASIQTFFINC